MPKYKYKINEQLGLLPRSTTIGQIEKILKKEHGISRDTFYRDRSMTIDDTLSIPSERLDIYAALLSVSAESLKNYTVKVKPLRERNSSSTIAKVKARTGLKN
jgi:hypothetical protein